MSSILTTDCDKCAVMIVDTVGGAYSTSLGVYENQNITWLKRFEYPNSLGLFYSTATKLLGFKPFSDECKVMSAAAYGEPKWADYIKEKVLNTEIETRIKNIMAPLMKTGSLSKESIKALVEAKEIFARESDGLFSAASTALG